MKYISLIESFYPSFSKQEKKVADYIISEKGNVSLMALQEITKKISVSEATIVRFVRKLGFKGFIDFKLRIAKETQNEIELNSDDYITNISNYVAKTIEETKALTNKEEVEKAISLIEESEAIYAFGLGASGVAAQELHNRFMRYGKNGNFASDSHLQIMYASLFKSTDVVIIISLSGETSELIYSAKVAKENGAKIIVITNYILSPIAKMADIVLLTAGRETPLDGGSLISKISQLFVIDILATGYALRNKEEALKVKEKIASAIFDKNK